MTEKERNEYLNNQVKKEKEFDDTLRKYINLSNRADQDDDEDGMSPDSKSASPTRSAASPARKFRGFGNRNIHVLSKMRQVVKTVMDENSTKVKLNNKSAVKQEYYEFIKNESKNHYVPETSTMFKIFQDLYLNSYYDHHQCPIPAFAFI